MNTYSQSVKGKSQADGAFILKPVVDIAQFRFGGLDSYLHHTIQVEVSEAPDAGILEVAVRLNGAENFITLGNTFDLTGDNLIKIFSATVDEIRFTPVGFDTDKTYNVIITHRE